MKKVIYFLIFSCLAFSVYCAEQQTTVVSGNKIIQGLSQSEALRKFGSPAKGNIDFWYYSGAEPFYVYFPKTAHKPALFVFPYSYTIKVGVPFEIKAFVLYPDFRLKEVTKYSNWFITDESKAKRKTNFFMPLKKGNTKILAVHKGMISNACGVLIEHSPEKESKQNKNLLAINIFPHKPVIEKGQKLVFTAFGTFSNSRLKTIYVKNISKNVSWFAQGKKGARKEQSNIRFTHPGREEVFCTYKGKKSNIQEIIIRKAPFYCREKIKNICLLPAFVKANKKTKLIMEVIATYDDNRVKCVGNKSSWQIDNKKVANLVGKGIVKLKKEGIAKIHVTLDKLHHSFSKILVTKKIIKKKSKADEIDYLKTEDAQQPKNAQQLKDTRQKEKKQKKNIKDLAKSIKKAIRALNPKSVKIERIKIKPKVLALPLGRTASFTAEAIYSDGSTINATSFVKWKSTNPENVTLKREKLLTHSRGTASVYAYLKEVKSNFSKITVNEPELFSIALDPQKLKLEVGSGATLKAFGYYSDSSKVNIVNKVSWIIEDKKLLEIGKNGKLKTEKKGTTHVYAQYGKIKSLPVTVKVFVSLLTILKKVISAFLMLCFGAYLLFYSLLKVKIWKLKKLISGDPSRFIKNIYENSKKVLGIFGSPHVNVIPALEYAKTVEKKFSISNNYFTRLTYNFFEAQYSSHAISARNAIHSLDIYNRLMKDTKKNSSGFLFKFWLLLIRGYPFLI